MSDITLTLTAFNVELYPLAQIKRVFTGLQDSDYLFAEALAILDNEAFDKPEEGVCAMLVESPDGSSKALVISNKQLLAILSGRMTE